MIVGVFVRKYFQGVLILDKYKYRQLNIVDSKS